MLAAALLLAGGAVLGYPRRSALLGIGPLPAPRETDPPSEAQSSFVGADRCAECHRKEYDAWSRSTHGRAGGAPSRDLVIAAFDGTPVRFANAQVTPRATSAGYEFVVREDGQAPHIWAVDGVIGGGHMEGGGTQGFVTRSEDGTLRFLPFDWSRHGHFWFCNTESRSGRGWVPITPSLRLQECGDWPPARVLGDVTRFSNCQGCHASQLAVALDTALGQRTTQFTSLTINCESCHGPGSVHVTRVAGGTVAADIGYRSLTVLDKDASLAVCFQCHSLKNTLRDGFRSGEAVVAYYSLKFPLLGDPALHPDGRVRTFAYQESHQYSDCYLNGGMTCTSCHDPHTQQYRDVAGAMLRGRFDDRQCTSCHASKAGDAAVHTHHAPLSAGSSCTSCHMPYLQHPETRPGGALRGAGGAVQVRYARSDHSIAIPRPRGDSALGVMNACLGCHATKSIAQLEREVRNWWGELKPQPQAIAAQLRFAPGMPLAEAIPLLLGAEEDRAGESNAMARFSGVSRLLENYVRPDDVGLPAEALQRLRQLGMHTDMDVRAIALATLHLAAGDHAPVRRLLARALLREGAHDAGLRQRWSLALGFMGDRFAGAHDLSSAAIAYRRAMEITPGSARVALALANVLRDNGEMAEAVGSYRRSIALDPAQPLAWVNLGIALAAAGDTAEAIRALDRATKLDRAEPLAAFNRANLHLAKGELDRAAQLYEISASLDPALAPARISLARVLLLKKDYPAALRELERGLAFDSTDVAALEARNALVKALRR